MNELFALLSLVPSGFLEKICVTASHRGSLTLTKELYYHYDSNVNYIAREFV